MRREGEKENKGNDFFFMMTLFLFLDVFLLFDFQTHLFSLSFFSTNIKFYHDKRNQL